ncbi:MAG: efflux RND transporter periplasmic adaptor subunit [Rikenellaceae bacterium]|nr:efflux RND transporter periplasmic adaptor subunit [Rikenellaceae bacterium]
MKLNSVLNIPFYAVLVCTAVSCGEQNAPVAEAQEKAQVTVQTVYSRDVEQSGTFTGTVESNVKNHIAPHTSVRIDQILVEVGDRVSRGQRLVAMDDISLQQARFQLENDSLEFMRIQEMHDFGGASRSELDAKKLAYDISQANYRNLAINTELISPISGVVTARNYDNGDMYSGGDPVLTVEQIRPVKILIHVSESLFAQVSRGMEVTVQFDVYGQERFIGKVSLIYPTIDPTTRTFPVEITLPNTDERIRPGMFSRVTIAYGSQHRVVVPDQAIVKLTGAGDRYVYVVGVDDTVEFRSVELGRRMEVEYEILSGLESGEVAIVPGQSPVTNARRVEIVK